MISRLRAVFSVQSLLMLMLLGLGGVAGEALAPSGIEVRLWTLALVAGSLGIVLGVLRVPDSISHLIAIVSGATTAVVLAASRLPQGIAGTPMSERVVDVVSSIRDWYIGTGTSRDTEDLLIVILMHMIVWLVSYLAAWSLMRQGWVTVAVLLPGIFVIASEVTGAADDSYLLEIFLVLSIVLLARMTFVRRSRREAGVSGARGRGWASLVTAAVVGVLVVTIGVRTPEDFSQSTVQPVAEYASDTLLNAQDRAGDWMAEHLGIEGSGKPDINDFPRYTAFDDAFSIGGELNLSDQPEVVVRTNGPAPYLTAQSYDLYNGRGWESTVEDTFEPDGPDGVRYAPELTFRPEQQVPYSGSVRDARAQETMEVTPLTPAGNIIFADGMYSTSDQRASVRMSWLQLDHTRFDLREMDLSTIPPDLTGIVSLLIRAQDLSVQGDGGLLYPSNTADRERLATVRSQLGDRFIDVSWTVAGDGRVADMIVTGQVPVYDDAVTVRRPNGAAGAPYQVTSLPSVATEDQLRGAATDYPAWVKDRYLQLPSTVTPRTVQLTNDLAAAAPTAFDKARIIEEFLRQHIVYDLEVGIPSRDKDIVDYVLFEQQRGYCEHYATAMTVMLRILGVPAKTVVGYFPASYDEGYGGYVYRQQNAHAWTEAFFPGYGWIRFEPTASQPESSFGEGFDSALPTPEATPTAAVQETPATPAGTPLPADQPPAPAAPETVPVMDNGGGGIHWSYVVLPFMALAAAGAGLWLVLGRAPALDPRALFKALVRWGRAAGVPSDASATPREYARHVGRKYPAFADDADQIVDVYEEQRYGGRAPEPGRIARAGEALRHLQREMIRRVARLGR